MTTTSEVEGVSTTEATVRGLIASAGLRPDRRVDEFVRLAAAVQQQRRTLGVSDVDGLTRTSALWTLALLDASIADALETSGVSLDALQSLLSIRERPQPLDVSDVVVHSELARALSRNLPAGASGGVIGLQELAVAILKDADQNQGLLGERLESIGAKASGPLHRLESGGSEPLAPETTGTTSTTLGSDPEPAAASHRCSDSTALYLGSYEALRPSRGDDAMWPAFALVASQRRNTTATVVVRALLSVDGSGSGDDAAAALRFFAIEAIDPVAVPDIGRHPLLAVAARVRDQVEPENEIVRLRHVVGAVLLHGSAPRGAATRTTDIEAVRSRFLDQMDHDAPRSVADRWRELLTSAATSELIGEPRPRSGATSTKLLAGIDHDLVDDTTALRDELGVVDDVVTLCDVVAARDAAPPISVGLFGRWGSGKSYFMAMMRRRIDELRREAAEAEARGEETTYCTEIVQLTFNAWHYMDAEDLWATLAVHLFSGIAQLDPQDERVRNRSDVVQELERRERRMSTIEQKIATALGDQRLDRAATSMGLDSPREDVLGLLAEVGSTRRHLAAVKVLLTPRGRTRRRLWEMLAVGAGLVGLVALAVLVASGAVSIAWLAACIPVAVAVARITRIWLRGITRGLREVNQIASDAGLKPRDVTAERLANDREILRLREELENIDRLTALHDWADTKAKSTDYTSRFSVISLLRIDLEALVEKQRRDAPDRRIVMYIDDLDRCSPQRVVDVLQAVHLLLAFPLFVVVVGVDPRWLLRSLEHHYENVLSTPDGAPAARPKTDVITETTPHDYLEKIFQIPFALRPMEPSGYGRLIRSLAPPPPARPEMREVGEPTDQSTSSMSSASMSFAGVDGAHGDVPGESTGDPPLQPTDERHSSVGGVTARQPAEHDDEGLPLAPISTNAPHLRLRKEESDALAGAGPLIGTPRAAKRLVNLYRLARAGLPDSDLEAFVSSRAYQPVVLVLAIQVGSPRVASRFLDALMDGADDATVQTIVLGLGDESEAARLVGPAEQLEWASLVERIGLLADDSGLNPTVADVRPWITSLRRFTVEGALASAARSAPASE